MKTDARLIAECIQGEENAWDALIDRYQRFIYTVILRCGMSGSDADDIFQNVCLSMYRNLHTLQNTEKLSAWLAAVARQEALRSIRFASAARRGGGAATVQMEDPAAANEPSLLPLPEEQALFQEQQYMLVTGLGELADNCRSLLEMLYLNDPPATYLEISSLLGMPSGSIGPSRSRCLGKLKKILDRLGYSVYFSGE